MLFGFHLVTLLISLNHQKYPVMIPMYMLVSNKTMPIFVNVIMCVCVCVCV